MGYVTSSKHWFELDSDVFYAGGDITGRVHGSVPTATRGRYLKLNVGFIDHVGRNKSKPSWNNAYAV